MCLDVDTYGWVTQYNRLIAYALFILVIYTKHLPTPLENLIMKSTFKTKSTTYIVTCEICGVFFTYTCCLKPPCEQ